MISSRNQAPTNIGITIPADMDVSFARDRSVVPDIVVLESNGGLGVMRGEDGYGAVGNTVGVAVVAIGVLAAANYFGFFNNGNSAKDLNREASVVVGHQTMNEVCVTRYFVLGAEVVTRYPTIGGVNFPGGDITAKVKGKTGVIDCSKADKTAYVLNRSAKTLDVTIPADSMTAYASIDPSSKQTTYGMGRAYKFAELGVAKSQMILALNAVTGGDALGWEATLDKAKNKVGSMADEVLMQRAVEGCGPTAYEAFTKDDLVKGNTDSINNIFKAIGRTDLKVNVIPPENPPNIKSEFTDRINQWKSDSSVIIQKAPPSENCTVSSKLLKK